MIGSALPEAQVVEACQLAAASAGVEEAHVAVEFVNFSGEDVVRHRLVQRIVEAYDDHGQSSTTELRAADKRRA